MAKILVVDDEPNLLEITKGILALNKYEVITAQDGAEAVEKVIGEKPDLIILDLSLPKIEGSRVCSLIKSDPALKYIPIIISSASSADSISTTFKTFQANDYFVKGSDLDELLIKIDGLLNKR